MIKPFTRIYLLTTSFLLLLSGILKAQDVSLELQHPPKLTDKQITELWNKAPAHVSVGFVTSSFRFSKQIPPPVHVKKTWNVKGWKNEKVHTQIVVTSKSKIANLTYTIGELRDNNGNKIQPNSFFTGFVQDVMTDEFRNGCGYRKSVDFDSSMVADIINSNIRSISINSKNTQAIWLSIHIPKNIPAGNYKGIILVKADRNSFPLPIDLTVVNRQLPDPKDWTYQLDLWQHPAAIARVHHVPLWSDDHFNLMRKYYSLLARAGQKIITASIVNEPWNHQTYDDYPSLVTWTKKKDGSWSYDYSLFDKYIHFVMSCGITQRINCYSMVPWKIAFPYFDEKSEKEVVFSDAIGTPEYNQFWGTMLKDFTRHLKEKGWFDITAIAMDERPMKDMQSVISLLKSIDPNWKISLAGDYHPEIEKDIYDYCVASRWTFPDSILTRRHQEGKKSTWYTCCTEKYPNGFTFSPPDENAWLGWYTAATGMDGYLRWAYNSWPAHPLKDSRFTAWPAGDTYQVYPGPLSSIRFEKLIEGVQDYEKIRMLKRIYYEMGDTQKVSQIEKALSQFRISNLANESAHQMIEACRNLLND